MYEKFNNSLPGNIQREKSFIVEEYKLQFFASFGLASTICTICHFSRIMLIYYCKYCNLIGYSTRYLFLDRQRVAKR